MGRSGRLYPQPLGQLEAEGDAGCHLWEEFQAGAEGAHIWPRMLPLKFPGRGGAGGYSPDREKSEAQREAGTPPLEATRPGRAGTRPRAACHPGKGSVTRCAGVLTLAAPGPFPPPISD